MTSMPFDASIYQDPFQNASQNVVVVAASFDDPNPCHPQPSESPSYFDLARLDSYYIDDSYAVYLAVAHAESTTAPNDVFLYTSSQATTTPPIQTVSPTEIHGHSPFCLCGSPGAPVVDCPSQSPCGSSLIPQTILGSSAYVEQQIPLNPFVHSFPTFNDTLAATRSGYPRPISPERRHSESSPQRPAMYHNGPFPRRSSWVAPTSAPMHIHASLLYPFLRSTSFSTEGESPCSIGTTSTRSVSSHSLFTPAYNSPVESPSIMNNLTTSLDGQFPISVPLLPAKSSETHLMNANPHQGIPIYIPAENELTPDATNSLEEDYHFSPAMLDMVQTTLETPARPSEEGHIPLARVTEEAVGTPAPPPEIPSHLQYLQSLRRVPVLSPLLSPATTPAIVPTDDPATTKDKETKSRPRNVQKESFAARHRIQVEIPSLTTSESSSLVHRTRRGRPSIGSIGDEFSTRFPGVPPPAPVDPRPAARRARQRKKNGNGDESYGASDKKFKCEFCGQTFGRKEHVKRHVSGIHQQIKAYQCDICGMCCSRSDNLRQHMRAHERDGHTMG